MKIQGTKIRGLKLYSSAATVDADSYFNLVSLLLPGNGTNGAQNNTFLDSSTNNFTVTRNGNTTQGTFSPFSFGGGTEQANGYYSGYFDGSGDYLTVADNTAFEFGSGDFTIEGWFYALSVASDITIVSKWTATGTANSNSWLLFVTSGVATFLTSTNGSAVDVNISGGAVTVNSWNHIAVSRSGNTYSLYLNGTRTATTTNSNSLADVATVVAIGRYSGGTFGYMNGYISNFRIVKGTAVYTANFTVPTTPLTNITNTSLLTCQSSQFIDNSTNAFAITVNGNSQPTVVNPFGMTAWSGYFDGTGDFLTVANNAAFDLGSGDATIETWIYPTSSGQTCGIFDKRSSGVNYSQFPQIALVSGAFVAYVSYSGSSWAGTINGATPAANTWTHVAFVRSGNTWTLYVNGAVSGTPFTASGSVYTSTDSLVIGASTTTGTNAFAGQISNARVVKGTAVYTSAFTPPTAPLTAISGTQLLTCQSSTFVDNSTNAFTITVNGNSYTGTLNNPFGSIVNYTTPPLQAWSNYFDGTGDYLSTADNASLDLGTSDFCIEGWFFLESTTEETIVAKWGAASNANSYLIFVQSGVLYFLTSTNGLNSDVSLTSPVTANEWYHVAAVRSGSSYALFLNGARVATVTNSNTIYDSASGITIGRYTGGSLGQLSGYVSNIRIVKGTAVYSPAQSTITVPTSPLSAVANTVLLTCQSNRFVDNSINRLAITQNGDTSVQPFSPFNPDAAYSTTSVGGSGYFDGNGDFLTVSYLVSNFGTGDFTLEVFVYLTAYDTVNDSVIIDTRSAGTANPFAFGVRGTGFAYYYTGTAYNSSTVVPLNNWVHLAICRSGTTLKIFQNGVETLSRTDNSDLTGTSTSSVIIGRAIQGLANVYGYLSNLRIVKGTALYTGNFTVPTAPLTAVTNTSLLLNATNAGITDAAAKNVLETVGSAQISTAQSKFGGSSMSFDGTGDILVARNSNFYNFSSGDFTVEFWYRTNTLTPSGPGSAGYGFIVGQTNWNGSTSGNGWAVFQFNQTIQFFSPASTLVSIGTGNVITSTSTWYHIAIVRNGTAANNTKIYVDGVQQAQGTPTISNSTSPLVVGGISTTYGWDTSYSTNGYLDDLRITKGYARYTANFTPPTAAFPTQ